MIKRECAVPGNVCIYLPHRRSMVIPRGRGMAKVKVLKEKYAACRGRGQMGKPKTSL